MKHLAIMILLVGISPRLLSGQAMKANGASQQSAGRASYDPMAHGKQAGQPKSIVETTLAGVNPQDKDYGSVVADWRKEVFENMLQTFYFWGLLGMALVLGVSIVGNGWLLRQREERLAVSADIVAQLPSACGSELCVRLNPQPNPRSAHRRRSLPTRLSFREASGHSSSLKLIM
jgi:hypothetical protein